MHICFARLLLPLLFVGAQISELPASSNKTHYVLTDLGNGTSAYAVDTQGEVARSYGLRAKDGTLIPLTFNPMCVNAGSAAGGGLFGTPGEGHAALYLPSRYVAGVLQPPGTTDLGTLGSDPFSEALASYGDTVVGHSFGNDTGERKNVGRAFIFQNGIMSALLPGIPISVATGIDENGTVVGYYKSKNSDSSPDRAFVLNGDEMTPLPAVPGYTLASQAFAINLRLLGGIEGIDIVGIGYGKHTSRGFIYSDGKFKIIEPPEDGASTAAFAVNNLEMVVGSMTSGREKAIVYERGSTSILEDAIVNVSGWKLTRATGINNSGIIVGYGRAPSGTLNGFLLTPVPALFISGPKTIRTNQPRYKIAGTTAGAVSTVFYSLRNEHGTSVYRRASGVIAWRFTAFLKPGRNRVSVVAFGPTGQLVGRAKVIVIKK